MPPSAGLGAYRTALTTPGARGPVVAALLGRMPIAMVGFSLLLYIQRVTGSYATGGAVSAAVLIGVATGSVVQGRMMDRVGPTRPLLAMVVVFAAFVVACLVGVEHGAPTPLLVALAVGIGTAQPTIGSTSRVMWTGLLPPGAARSAALTYESVMTEVYFIVGPALSGLLLTAPWPGTGVIVGAALMVTGTVWYALTPTVRRMRPAPSRTRSGRRLGALASPGLRTVTLASLGLGIILGFVEVAIPAAANHAGHVAAGGVLLGLWSISSAVFGILYGVKPWPTSLRLRIPALLAGFALLMVPMMIPGSLPGLAVTLLLAGTLIAPQTTAHAEAIEFVVVHGLLTESFAWVITASTLGIGLGQAASGQIVEHGGVRHSFLAAGAIGLVLAFVVYLRRDTVIERAQVAEAQSVA